MIHTVVVDAKLNLSVFTEILHINKTIKNFICIFYVWGVFRLLRRVSYFRLVIILSTTVKEFVTLPFSILIKSFCSNSESNYLFYANIQLCIYFHFTFISFLPIFFLFPFFPITFCAIFTTLLDNTSIPTCILFESIFCGWFCSLFIRNFNRNRNITVI